jgi:hypothetical protein
MLDESDNQSSESYIPFDVKVVQFLCFCCCAVVKTNCCCSVVMSRTGHGGILSPFPLLRYAGNSDKKEMYCNIYSAS